MEEDNKCSEAYNGGRHEALLSYKGYHNIYFCPKCGKRFNTTYKEDKTY